MKRSSKVQTLIIGVILIVGVILLLDYGFVDSIKALSALKLSYLLITFIVFFVFTTLRILPWYVTVRKLGIKMGFWRSLLMVYYFWGISSLLSIFGQLFSLRDLNRFKRNAKYFSGNITLSVTLIGTLALSVLALISGLLISEYVVYAFAFVIIFYGLSSLLGFNFTQQKIINILRKRKEKFLKGLLKYVVSLSKFRGLFSQRYILLTLLAFMPTLLFEASILYFILLAENQSISFIVALFIFSFSDVIGAFSLSPSGLGAMDATMVVLLLAAGAPGAITISTVLLFRFFQLFLPALEGYASFFIIQRIKQSS